MNPRTTIALIAALVIAVVGVWWAQSSSNKPKEETKTTGPQALFEPPLDELTGFELKSADGSDFVFTLADKKWRMTAPMDAVTEHFKVNGDATMVKDLKYSRKYGKGDADRPGPTVTGLDKPQRTVKLTDKSGKSQVLMVGSAQPLSQKTFVLKEGDDTIYLADADLNKDLRRTLADYRGKRVAEFNQNDAVRVEMAGDRPYTLVKTDGKWTVEAPVKGRADAAKVNNLVRALASLNAADFVEDAPKTLRPYGLETPRLRVAVTTETKKPVPQSQSATTQPEEQKFETETKTIRVAFGGGAGDKVFAKIDEPSAPAVFDIQSTVMDQVNVPLEDVRDKQVVTADTRRTQRILVAAGNESVELYQAGGRWQITGPEGPGASPEAELAAVDDLLKTIRELKATGFEAADSPSFGFASPRATITLTIEGQVEPVRLVVGGLTPSKTGAYVRNDAEGLIAVVKAESAEALAVRPMAFRNRELVRFIRDQATRVEVEHDGIACAAARGATGDWQLVAPVAGKAESKAVENILTDLSNLRGRKVVGGIAEAAAFGLDKPTVRATVVVQPPPKPKPAPTTQPTTESAPETEEPPPPPVSYTVLLARQGDKAYAEVPDGQIICEVDAKVLDDLQAELLDTVIATIDPAQGRRLAFSFAAEGSFSFEKKGNDWTLAGEASFAADPAKVTAVFEGLRDLRAKRYVQYTAPAAPAAFGLDKPVLVLTAQAEGGEPITLSISAIGPDGGDRFAAVATAPDRVFVIKAADVAKFAKKVQDFQKAG